MLDAGAVLELVEVFREGEYEDAKPYVTVVRTVLLALGLAMGRAEVN